jgi:hypothetical protein
MATNFQDLQEKFQLSKEVTLKTLEACSLDPNQSQYSEPEVERFAIARKLMADGDARSYNDVKAYFAQQNAQTESNDVQGIDFDLKAAEQSAEALARQYQQVVAMFTVERIQEMVDSGEMHTAYLQLIQQRGLRSPKFLLEEMAQRYINQKRQAQLSSSPNLMQLPESPMPLSENGSESRANASYF